MPVQPIPQSELDTLEPPTDFERHKRAMFMAAQTGRHSIELIRKVLNHCDTIDFNGGGAIHARYELDNETHYNAMKEMAALSIWLALAEQLSGGMPEWLKVFFCDSWACADILMDEPLSKEILAYYPPTRELSDTYQTAAMRLCHNLHLGDTVQDALLFFSDTLSDAASVRAQILRWSLQEPLPELDRLMNEPAPV